MKEVKYKIITVIHKGSNILYKNNSFHNNRSFKVDLIIIWCIIRYELFNEGMSNKLLVGRYLAHALFEVF